MSDVYVQFADFVTTWRSMRPDIVLRISLLRSEAVLPGDPDELYELLLGIDKIVEGLRRGEVASLATVFRCCHSVRSRRQRDGLFKRIWILSATYRHTLFVTRPLPPAP